MPTITNVSIRTILSVLMLLAMMPALLIILYSGFELRRKAIATAKSEVLLLAQTMGEVQKGITQSTHQVLFTLAQNESVRLLDRESTSPILRAIVEHNSTYVSLAAMDIHGEVFAASNPFSPTNLADRHHFQEAIAKKTLATSNFMMSRVGMSVPTIAFAHPVLDIEGHLTGVVSAILNLENYVNLFDLAAFPPNSFAAVRGDIPIILCTGFSEQISASKARQKGIKGFLMKPLVRGELANMVRQVLDEAANDKS
jgi:hypothetical protein